jgi:hypothetical protein
MVFRNRVDKEVSPTNYSIHIYLITKEAYFKGKISQRLEILRQYFCNVLHRIIPVTNTEVDAIIMVSVPARGSYRGLLY